MGTTWRRGLGWATAVVLAAGVVGLGVVGDRRTATRRASAPAAHAATTTTTASAPAAVSPDMPGFVAPASLDLRLHGTEQRFEFSGVVDGLDRVVVDDASFLRFEGQVADGHGRNLGSGTVTASGPVTVTGGPLRLAGAWALENDGLRVANHDAQLDLPAAYDVAAGTIDFAAPGQRAPTRVDGPVHVTQGQGPTTFADTARVTGLPPRLALSGGRTTVAWSGSGEITVGGTRFTGATLGAKLSQFSGAVNRSTGAVEGTGRAEQVYTNGWPRLRAQHVAVDLPVSPFPTLPGQRGHFSWAPRNNGDVDMTIMRVRPVSREASWINLRLDRLPAMDGTGGDGRGGDTTGLADRGTPGPFGFGSAKAAPINAVILPRTADRREISFDVPAGTPPGRYQFTVAFEGNFDTITFTATVEVVPASSTSRH